MEVAIKSYKVGQRGQRGLVISIPKWWAEYQDVKAGDKIILYADDKGRLILEHQGDSHED